MSVRKMPERDNPVCRGREYEVPWDGRPMRGTPYLAFDTETDTEPDQDGNPTVDLSRRVPRLSLLTATNGHRTVVVSPDQLPEFVCLHAGADWAGFNTQFDYWAVHEELRGRESVSALGVWRRAAREGRLYDAMLLDFLVMLAEGRMPIPRNLGAACKDILGFGVDKDDPYRMRFGELIGADWGAADPGFFEYAVRDVMATWELYGLLCRRGEVAAPAGQVAGCGLLTEGIQVGASIALAQIGRNGMAVDLGKVAEVRGRLAAQIEDRVIRLRASYPRLFSYYKVGARKGQMKLNRGTRVPHMSALVLREYLAEVAAEAGLDPQSLPRTAKTGALATPLDVWREIAPDHPLVRDWAGLSDDAKVLQFLVKLTEGSVHPSYKTLVRTGRTSAASPNIQQMPRASWFRELFVARPGHKLVIVDYSAIELRTLAAVCLDRFGRSVLAETIKAGRDPHAYTAALANGWEYAEVAEGVRAEKAAAKAAEKEGRPRPPAPFSEARQAAKAINFGVPGGLGAKKLAAYAKANYGVALSEEQAQEFRDRLTRDIYPELGEYLKDDFWGRLSANLKAPVEEVRSELGRRLGDMPGLPFVLERVVAGLTTKKNGRSISPSFVDEAFGALASLCQDSSLRYALYNWSPGERLRVRVLGDRAVTRTGRLRKGISYTEARNTPFQGLAADGAKLALWRLHDEGFRVVAFIHDEVVVEAPDLWADGACQEVQLIMQEEMAKVVGWGIPIETEAKVSSTWSK